MGEWHPGAGALQGYRRLFEFFIRYFMGDFIHDSVMEYVSWQRAFKTRELVTTKMTPQQIAEAKRLVAEWTPVERTPAPASR